MAKNSTSVKRGRYDMTKKIIHTTIPHLSGKRANRPTKRPFSKSREYISQTCEHYTITHMSGSQYVQCHDCRKKWWSHD